MYPDMIEDAKSEGERAAERYFNFANQAEECHANLYTKALDTLENPEETAYFVCSVCGHIHEGQPEDKCPICNAPVKSYFEVKQNLTTPHTRKPPSCYAWRGLPHSAGNFMCFGEGN
eukprot:TRINITY_DN6168_c0_g1_i10.p2 TRINITY_DN6168_c0_g1~~TRINITY_DN6168_c0_g1_i10.p2  ORF type:complete len:117 (+),score=12.82 TRINITY_DN6168_c0_g1_i10:3-353(+)